MIKRSPGEGTRSSIGRGLIEGGMFEQRIVLVNSILEVIHSAWKYLWKPSTPLSYSPPPHAFPTHSSICQACSHSSTSTFNPASLPSRFTLPSNSNPFLTNPKSPCLILNSGQKSFPPSPTYTIRSHFSFPPCRRRYASSSSPLHMFARHPTEHPCGGEEAGSRRPTVGVGSVPVCGVGDDLAEEVGEAVLLRWSDQRDPRRGVGERTARMVPMYISFELDKHKKVVSGSLACKPLTARFIAGC